MKKDRLIKVLVMLALLGVSCGAFARLQEAKDAEVKACKFLDEIEGRSGYGKSYDWKALAKSSVFDQAEKIAASHVVWVRFESVGGFNGIAVAKAYLCD